MIDIHALIFQILLYAIQLTVVVLFGALCNFLIKKTAQSKLTAAVEYAKQAVQAAEQILGSGLGADKKKLVVDWVTRVFKGKFTSDEIEELIESAVYDMNLVLKSKIDQTVTVPSTTRAATEQAETVIDTTQSI